ncbi:MAG: plasmid partitioning protein RepB [Xanthobacter sp. 17-67-6]|uniref:ParB-like partition protein n=1 Tax=Xanthobacter autotrophicus (strain ATCC BAA-1158 / Py2) TaxID=78245 RepID=A7IPR1_XANP2|nr:parB-like partition protein [Xanthobacter autotrophicus Py2]OYX88947.1 MAG: plasmid partitioning protein RepB [Xanthobacter sp. 35-67-6]OYZ95803.1 MAG: plasmid partitioning protein RepB [Xanthobacter sp. 17-67-6]
MSRKDTLKAMLTRRTDELPGGNSSLELAAPTPVAHVRSGAVGAMGRSLGQIATAAERARALVASGAAVVDIPAEKLLGSFAQDRLDDEGTEYETLFNAIKESGQKSPILVRPHPDRPDYYQIAYGHRRAKILAKLGRPVRAVVQDLTDEELVVIQGQENSARKDLSYIERGLFAMTLEDQGFDRAVIMSALSMEKTQLSRLLALAKSVPKSVVHAIGPAPKAGRPRWTALAERLSELPDMSRLDEVLADPKFQQADTDQRFVRLFNAIAPNRGAAKPRKVAVKTDAGNKIATVERGGDTVTIIVDADGSREFGEFIAAKLLELYQQFEENKEAPI